MSRETCNNVATNLQRAIRHFEHLILQLGDSTHDGPILSEHKKQSTKMAETALSAMREQLEREKGCEYCQQGEEMAYGKDGMQREGYIYLDGNLLTADLYSDSMAVAVCYCPMCGRQLKDEPMCDGR